MAVVGIVATLMGLALGMADIFAGPLLSPIGQLIVGIGVIVGFVLTAIGFS